ncbi:MAG: copper resistance protein B [Caulobacterales bacterium]|nr:copper resistance protein B [Caulobacterales bacterium]
MRIAAFLAAVLTAATTPAFAQHEDHPMPPASPPAPKPAAEPGPTPAPAATPEALSAMDGMDHGAMEEEVGAEPPPPPPADHAADGVFDPAAMARARQQLQAEHGGGTVSKVMLNRGEVQLRDGETGYRWDGEAWIGGDLNRFVLKTEGEGADGDLDAAEAQALYSRAIGPYFDLQVGLRQDFEPTPRRTYLTVGFEGLAPYWFEAEGAVFVSNKGDLSARLEGTYDLRLTQRWILQPRAEVNLAAQDVPEIGLGSGVSEVELGLRLRYELRREFAPYVGLSFERKVGGTADFARALGEDVEETSVVFGLRAWF